MTGEGFLSTLIALFVSLYRYPKEIKHGYIYGSYGYAPYKFSKRPYLGFPYYHY